MNLLRLVEHLQASRELMTQFIGVATTNSHTMRQLRNIGVSKEDLSDQLQLINISLTFWAVALDRFPEQPGIRPPDAA